jgi:hypothetical protein
MPVEEVQFLRGGGLDVGVLAQEVVEKACTALFPPDHYEVGQHAHPRLARDPWSRLGSRGTHRPPLLRCAQLPFQLVELLL